MHPPQQRRHFSMVRGFGAADYLTLLNGVAGMAAVLAFVRFCSDDAWWSFWCGAALLPVALLFDVLDGRVARLRNEASPMGRELDSLADIVSFGVAPAVMAFAAGLRGGWDILCLLVFVSCGIARLARYNVTAESLSQARGKVTYFEGMPIPSSLLLALFLALLLLTGHSPATALGWAKLGPADLHFAALLFLVHGLAMVSKTLRIPKP
jgi:CDP-diacylglycerol---serine O-phosphatidyltransferase